MAMGKPVVVSATEGQSDVIEDGVTGVTVPPGDSESLGEAIRSLISSPSERRRLGRNAREAFAARFTLDHYAEALLNQMHLLGNGIPSEKFDQHPRRMTT
jgi:glycosyltransferase involved in cell wall biosynthesis